MPIPTAAATISGIATSPKFFCSQIRRSPADIRNSKSAPNGFWIDLDIAPGEKRDLNSGLRRRVSLDEAAKTWVAELGAADEMPDRAL